MFPETGAFVCSSLHATTSIQDKETLDDTADKDGRFLDVTTLHFARVEDLLKV